MHANALSRDLWVDLIGKPWRHRGRGPDAYDCYGLLREIYRRQGIELPDAGYEADNASCSAALISNLPQWQRCEIIPGAGLLFRRGAAPQHVGVALDDDRFIHATEDFNQVVISRLDDPMRHYRAFLLGAFHYAV